MKVIPSSGLEKPSGSVVFLKRVGENIICESENLNITTSHDLEKVLIALAELGYEIAILDESSFGFEGVREIKTLSEIVREVKREKNAELCGAIGIFIGFVRRMSGEKEVVRLEYEAYEPVFSEKIAEIEKRLEEYPGVEGVRIHHKTGVLKPGEDIVYVVIMGRHRKNLWKPLSESMEMVKRELPVWKKEVYKNGEVWVHDKSE